MKAPLKSKLLCAGLLILSLANLSAAQNEDDAAIAALINNYFTALAQKDLGALVRLWSERSPDLAASIADAQRSFAADEYNFSETVISRTRVSGNKAILQSSSKATITDVRTRVSRNELLTRGFALIKEYNQWKIWRDAPASQDLSPFLERGSEWKVSRDTIEQFATALLAARNDEERNKLLADNSQMVTTELREALVRRVGQQTAGGPSALPILQMALTVARRANDKLGIAIVQRELGNAFRASTRLADAVEQYKLAVAGFDALGNKRDRAAVLVSLGQAYFAQTSDDLAIDAYTKALADFEELKNTRATADTLEAIACVYYDREKYNRALELFERCLKLRETYAGKAEIAATENSIGNVYFQQHEYELAIQRYLKALAGFEALKDEGLKDLDAVASTMSNIASTAYAQGNADTALDYYLKALALQEQLRSNYVAANLRLNISAVYSSQGNYSSALDNLRQALAVFEMLRDKNKIGTALSDIAEIYFHLHNYPLALENYRKCVAIYEQLNSLSETSMRVYAIGNVHFAMGNFDLAIESYQKALGQFETIRHAPGVASMLASIGGSYYAQLKYEPALDYYQKSLAKYEALGDRARSAGVIERIASVYYSQSSFAQSLEWSARAVSMAEQTASLDTLWRARLTQGLVYRALDRPDDAQQSLARSIAAIESMRDKLVRGESDAQHFFLGKNAAWLAMMELLISGNKITEAFAYSERIRANMLIDVLQQARIDRTMSATEQQEERRHRNQVVAVKAQISHERDRAHPDDQVLSNLNNRLEKALKEYRAFETRLYELHPRLRMLRGEAETIKLDDASALIPDAATAVIQFVVADTKTYLFVLTRNAATRRSGSVRQQAAPYSVISYPIGIGRLQLSERVEKFRELIAQRDSSVQTVAREIYDLLLAPAAEQLGNRAVWVILPDDALWRLPFAALRTADGRYLIEDHSLAYAPSLSALAEMSRGMLKAPLDTGSGTAPVAGLLAFANPAISKLTSERAMLTGSGVGLESSSDSENEVKALQRLYSDGASRIFVGPQASEDTAKREMPKFRIVHFASPARLNDASAMYTHIPLAQSEENSGEDGLLEAWELTRMDSRADLIAFSASELARERSSPADGLVGLSWALFVSGCPTTVLSQWRAASPSTTALMLEFHRGLRRDALLQPASKRSGIAPKTAGIGAAQALRQSIVKLLANEQYSHPFYWAGFEVIGNGR